MEEFSRSDSGLGGSSATLARGAQILDGVAAHGVIKMEPDDEEEEIMKQIQVGPQHASSCKLYCNHPRLRHAYLELQALQQAIQDRKKAGQ